MPARKKRSTKRRKTGPKYTVPVSTAESRELTTDLIDELCEGIARGNFRYVAIQRAGVSLHRFKYWVERAKKERKKRDAGKAEEPSLFVYMLERIEQAEGECHANCIEDVLESDDPRLVLDFMKLRWNKLYTNNPNARIDDEEATEQKVDTKALLRERLAMILGLGDRDDG